MEKPSLLNNFHFFFIINKLDYYCSCDYNYITKYIKKTLKLYFIFITFQTINSDKKREKLFENNKKRVNIWTVRF